MCMKKNMQRTQGCFSVKLNNVDTCWGKDFSANRLLEVFYWRGVDCSPSNDGNRISLK